RIQPMPLQLFSRLAGRDIPAVERAHRCAHHDIGRELAAQSLPRPGLIRAEHTASGENQRGPGHVAFATMKLSMKFDATAYGPRVAGILALDGNGERLMPLASGRCSSAEALARIQTAAPEELFPHSHQPQAAVSGLYLYFSCIDQAH